MNTDIRIKAYKKYHRKRWYEYRHYIYNFEYRITGVHVDLFFFNSKITFDIEIRNITQYNDVDLPTPPGYYDKLFNMYIDKELGRPKKRMVRSFNFKIRSASELAYSFVNMVEGFGIVPPSTFKNIYEIGKIKYV